MLLSVALPILLTLCCAGAKRDDDYTTLDVKNGKDSDEDDSDDGSDEDNPEQDVATSQAHLMELLEKFIAGVNHIQGLHEGFELGEDLMFGHKKRKHKKSTNDSTIILSDDTELLNPNFPQFLRSGTIITSPNPSVQDDDADFAHNGMSYGEVIGIKSGSKPPSNTAAGNVTEAKVIESGANGTNGTETKAVNIGIQEEPAAVMATIEPSNNGTNTSDAVNGTKETVNNATKEGQRASIINDPVPEETKAFLKKLAATEGDEQQNQSDEGKKESDNKNTQALLNMVRKDLDNLRNEEGEDQDTTNFFEKLNKEMRKLSNKTNKSAKSLKKFLKKAKKDIDEGNLDGATLDSVKQYMTTALGELNSEKGLVKKTKEETKKKKSKENKAKGAGMYKIIIRKKVPHGEGWEEVKATDVLEQMQKKNKGSPEEEDESLSPESIAKLLSEKDKKVQKEEEEDDGDDDDENYDQYEGEDYDIAKVYHRHTKNGPHSMAGKVPGPLVIQRVHHERGKPQQTLGLTEIVNSGNAQYRRPADSGFSMGEGDNDDNRDLTGQKPKYEGANRFKEPLTEGKLEESQVQELERQINGGNAGSPISIIQYKKEDEESYSETKPKKHRDKKKGKRKKKKNKKSKKHKHTGDIEIREEGENEDEDGEITGRRPRPNKSRKKKNRNKKNRKKSKFIDEEQTDEDGGLGGGQGHDFGGGAPQELEIFPDEGMGEGYDNERMQSEENEYGELTESSHKHSKHRHNYPTVKIVIYPGVGEIGMGNSGISQHPDSMSPLVPHPRGSAEEHANSPHGITDEPGYEEYDSRGRFGEPDGYERPTNAAGLWEALHETGSEPEEAELPPLESIPPRKRIRGPNYNPPLVVGGSAFIDEETDEDPDYSMGTPYALEHMQSNMEIPPPVPPPPRRRPPPPYPATPLVKGRIPNFPYSSGSPIIPTTSMPLSSQPRPSTMFRPPTEAERPMPVLPGGEIPDEFSPETPMGYHPPMETYGGGSNVLPGESSSNENPISPELSTNGMQGIGSEPVSNEGDLLGPMPISGDNFNPSEESPEYQPYPSTGWQTGPPPTETMSGILGVPGEASRPTIAPARTPGEQPPPPGTITDYEYPDRSLDPNSGPMTVEEELYRPRPKPGSIESLTRPDPVKLGRAPDGLPLEGPGGPWEPTEEESLQQRIPTGYEAVDPPARGQYPGGSMEEYYAYPDYEGMDRLSQAQRGGENAGLDPYWAGGGRPGYKGWLNEGPYYRGDMEGMGEDQFIDQLAESISAFLQFLEENYPDGAVSPLVHPLDEEWIISEGGYLPLPISQEYDEIVPDYNYYYIIEDPIDQPLPTAKNNVEPAPKASKADSRKKLRKKGSDKTSRRKAGRPKRSIVENIFQEDVDFDDMEENPVFDRQNFFRRFARNVQQEKRPQRRTSGSYSGPRSKSTAGRRNTGNTHQGKHNNTAGNMHQAERKNKDATNSARKDDQRRRSGTNSAQSGKRREPAKQPATNSTQSAKQNEEIGRRPAKHSPGRRNNSRSNDRRSHGRRSESSRIPREILHTEHNYGRYKRSTGNELQFGENISDQNHILEADPIKFIPKMNLPNPYQLFHVGSTFRTKKYDATAMSNKDTATPKPETEANYSKLLSSFAGNIRELQKTKWKKLLVKDSPETGATYPDAKDDNESIRRILKQGISGSIKPTEGDILQPPKHLETIRQLPKEGRLELTTIYTNISSTESTKDLSKPQQ